MIQIISVGKINSDYNLLAEKYRKMIKLNLKEYELTYTKKLSDEVAISYEETLILNKIKQNSGPSIKIALDERGKDASSHEFSEILAKAQGQGRGLNFIIGGAFGLSAKIRDEADIILRLSKLTFPHMLAKVILLEQIYRAETILCNHPYHK